jgi:hypothetical protein
MKPIDYLYFNIYNHFYRRTDNFREFYARIQAMYLFSLSAGGWILFLEAVYLRMIRHSWFTSKPGATLFAAAVYLLTALIFHHIYIVKERDQKILGKYAERWDRNPKKNRDLLISVFVIVIPYLFLGSLALFFPRHL